MKTKYIIKGGFSGRRYGLNRQGYLDTYEISTELEASTVSGLLRKLPKGDHGLDLDIVKVTETPGTGEQRREFDPATSKLQRGETLKWAIHSGIEYAVDITADIFAAGKRWSYALIEARLYDKQETALKDVQRNAKANGIYEVRLVQVAVKANEPVITETVLQ